MPGHSMCLMDMFRTITYNMRFDTCCYHSDRETYLVLGSMWIEPQHDKINKMTWAPSKNSDQPGHLPSLIFAVRIKEACILSYPLNAQRRLWSVWADAQAELSLRWAHVILLVLSCCGSIVDRWTDGRMDKWMDRNVNAYLILSPAKSRCNKNTDKLILPSNEIFKIGNTELLNVESCHRI